LEWNQYPGARCDTPSEFYCYTFSEALYKGWTWSSLYPRQEEILDYLNYAADKLELRQDIQLNTRVTLAEYDESVNRWKIETEDGNFAVAKYFIPAIGGLAVPHTPDIKGIENFKGEQYHTSRWPHEKVDFRGKRVGVIGTGSSGVQAITAIAKEADHLTVFQRTPHHTFQIRNPLLSPEEIKKMKEDFPKLRQRVLEHPIGMPSFPLLNNYSALDDSPEERTKLYERVWEEVGGFQFLFAYNDLITNDEANKTLEEFMHCKIKEIVKDPETANNLLPNHLIGGKRPICVSNYLETYNRENVTEEEWTNQLNEIGKVSVFSKVDSWYVGANIEGKPRGFLGHPGDFSTYQEHIYNSSKDYKGFKFTLYQSSTSK